MPFVFLTSPFLGLQHQDKNKESPWYWTTVLVSPDGAWIYRPTGRSCCQDSPLYSGTRGRSTIQLTWVWSLFLRKHSGSETLKKSIFVSFSPHLSLANCATLLFLVLLFSICGLIFASFWVFFFLLNQPPYQEKMNHKWKCLFFQEYNFVALCVSIFVEIQKVWFNIDGLFLRDVFFLIL